MLDRKKIDEVLGGLTEKLAAIEHERWSHWQRYMHSQGQLQPDGSILIPAKLVNQWEKQAVTKFVDLTDSEKQSDRDQVNRYLPVVADILNKSLDEC